MSSFYACLNSIPCQRSLLRSRSSHSATQRTTAAIHPKSPCDTDTFASTRYLNPSVSVAAGLAITQGRPSTRSLPPYLQNREEPAAISIRIFCDCSTTSCPHRQPDSLKSSFPFARVYISRLASGSTDRSLSTRLRLAAGSKIWQLSAE